MSEHSTIAAGPTYIASSQLVGNNIFDGEEHDYLSGAIAQQFATVHDQISTSIGDFNPAQSAPRFQITSSADLALKRFAQSLASFVSLTDGWNGPYTFAPTSMSIFVAMNTCLRLIELGLPEPTPKILSDGTLGVFWTSKESYAAIDFEDDGEHVWTVTNGKNLISGTWQTRENAPQDFYKISNSNEP